MGNMGAANSVTTDHQGTSQVECSGRYLAKLKVREFAGDALERPEWSGEIH